MLNHRDIPLSLRPLAWGGTVSAVGSGVWFTVWALFLTRRVGLSAAQAGIALSIAGTIGFVSPAPLGRLADRHGPREVYGILMAAEGIAILGFLACHSFAAVTAVAAATAAADRGKTGVRTALVAQLAGGEGRLRALAALRSWSHGGDAVGAGLGALVIGLDSGPAYAAAIVFNALTFFVYAAALRRVPHVPPTPTGPRRTGPRRTGPRRTGPRGTRPWRRNRTHGRPSLSAFRDLPYVALAAICAVLTLCWGVMSAGLPLWIAARTHAPHALSGGLVLISSVAIAALQVRFSRTSDTPRAAATTAVRSGLSLAASCVLFALAAGPAALPATALLLAGGGAHVLGELWFVAASWGLSVPLMPPERPAEYQGVFATGEGLAVMLAPATMTAVVIPLGTTGWLGLGVAFAAAGVAAPPAAAWAIRTRQTPHTPPPPPAPAPIPEPPGAAARTEAPA